MKNIENINVDELELLSDGGCSKLFKIEDGKLLLNMYYRYFKLEDVQRWMRLNYHWYANCKFVFINLYDQYNEKTNEFKRYVTSYRISRTAILNIK